MKVTYVMSSGERIALEATDGDTLMRTAIVNNVDGIIGECGGSMMCGTCHVFVHEPHLAQLPEPSVGELELLDCAVLERRENSRLSCQIQACSDLDGIVVTVPGSQR
ncbi:2Fe-2S ferredoxin [Bradyrhizobium macuxiense]|uniref:2Fe-2S ferredoxin n=1 Tax=Bradyrhizobium macuxiense TaxID=1755647 RepID=A0A560KX02_9BRAD|nr:2Fe-2S iron-sulfur cluster-binding protein [Bradyrhizobium macuxiense]TWB87768.1 2Fe-2S ferredoxin [Bradyrhizobium macuxiense]